MRRAAGDHALGRRQGQQPVRYSGVAPSYKDFAPAAGAATTQVPVGQLDIQVTVEVDCTPQEARASLGLPDVTALNEALISEMQAVLNKQLRPKYHVRVEERVAKSVNLQSGEGVLEFSVEHQDAATGAPLKVPAAFHIRIPILRGGPTYSIPVRLRYRVGGGKVSWFFQMHRPELFLLDAVDASIERVKLDADAAKPEESGCGLPVYMGNPPATT